MVGHRIYELRGKRVILDADAAILFKMPTKRLNEKVRRHAMRFSGEDVFRVTHKEFESMRSQADRADDNDPYFKPQNFDMSYFATSTYRSEAYRPKSNAPVYPSKINKKGNGGRRHLPHVFTEVGFEKITDLFGSFLSEE